MAPKKVKPNGKGASAPQAAPPKAAKKSSKKTGKAKQTTPKSHYIRNLHGGAGGARLDLNDGTRLHLEPRGQVGDVALIHKAQAEDPVYQRNINVLFEELTLAEGQKVIEKQNTNPSAPRPSLMDHITNPKGEKYAQVRATIEPSFESQGVVVGTVESSGDGRFTEKNVEVSRAMGPQQVQVPGSTAVAPQEFDPNVMPSGLTMEQAQLYMQTAPEQRYMLLQQFQNEAASTYRDGLNVNVGPTERE